MVNYILSFFEVKGSKTMVCICHDRPTPLLPTASRPTAKRFVLVVEHDLAVLDYLSDYICCLYGTPSAYGVVTMPFSVREGINIFLAGFVPTENLRFRDVTLDFKVRDDTLAVVTDFVFGVRGGGALGAGCCVF